ncbi:hypothetical protein GCM10027612_53720 [Microbispora bryophytorum subsp. camponoti]
MGWGRLVRARPHVEQRRAHDQGQEEQHDRRPAQMDPGVEARARRQRAHRAARERPHAPHAVQPGHDRTAEPLLDHHPLGVHRDIADAGNRAVQHERRAQQGQVRRQRGQDEDQAPQADRDAGDGPPAEPVREAPGGRHREDGADGGREQGEPELAGPGPDVVLDPGDAGGETPGHRPVQGEGDRHRKPGPPQLPKIHDHTLCPLGPCQRGGR